MNDLTEKAFRLLNLFERIENELSSGPASYYMGKLAKAYQYLLDEHSKFQVGDRVKLVNQPNFNKTSGWSHCSHYLVNGATGTVREIDFNGSFTMLVEIDNQTYFDCHGVEKKVDKPHCFNFDQCDFERA